MLGMYSAQSTINVKSSLNYVMSGALPTKSMLLSQIMQPIWSQLLRKATGNTFHVFPHTLNLVVKDAIKTDTVMDSILEKCGAIVKFFHQSTKASDKMKTIQNQLQLPEHRLIQAVDTRWNSVLYMPVRLYEQEAVTTALCLLGKKLIVLVQGRTVTDHSRH